MLRLYDKTRRRLCIAAFFLLCVVPTAAVLLWSVWRHLPGHAAAEARRLSQQTGLAVSIEEVRRLRPGAMLYVGLKLSDPETGNSVLRCRMLEAEWIETQREGTAQPALVLIASQPQIEVAAFDRFGQLLQRILERQTGPAACDVRLTAGEVTLQAESRAQTLTDFGGAIDASTERTQAQAVFRLAGVDTQEPIWVRLVRKHRATPSTGFELDTRGGSVPCDLLALGLERLSALGSRSRFRGCIWADRTAEGWKGEVTGQLYGVELGPLVGDRFPHKLSGTAEMTIQSARFRRGRLEELSGALTAGPGIISGSLVAAAVEELGLAAAEPPPRATGLLPYETLGLRFSLDANGLQLQGSCDSGASGTVLVGRDNLLLGQPKVQPLPVVSVLKTLVPANELQVPASRETDWLMRLLPLPPLVTPEDAAPPLPNARLRLGRELR